MISCTYMKTPFTCTYATPEFSLEFSAGSPATVGEAASLERIEGSLFFCPANVSLSAEYASFFQWKKKPSPCT